MALAILCMRWRVTIEIVRKFDAQEPVKKKTRDLGPNQTTQIGVLLDNKLLQDRDPQFEWTIA